MNQSGNSLATATRPMSTWRNLTIAALVATGLLYLLLEAVIAPLMTHEELEPIVAVVLVGNFVLAGLLLRVRAGWLALVAAAFLLLGVRGAIPHDLPAVIHPDGVGHFVFGVLLLGVPIVGAGAGLLSLFIDRRSAAVN